MWKGLEEEIKETSRHVCTSLVMNSDDLPPPKKTPEEWMAWNF